MPDAIAAKSIEDSFSDWEGHVFGYGYGTGERYVIPALREFLEMCSRDHVGYDYEELERELSPATAWLLINAMAHADIIEYGTSPRYGWLTPAGRRLKAFIATKTDDELVMLGCRDSDYDRCYPDACNHGPEGYVEGRRCPNPFWDK